MRAFHPVARALALVSCAGFIGCSNDSPPSAGGPDPDDGGGGGPSGVQIHRSSDPRVSFDPASGKTTVVIQFIARDDGESPLTPNDVIVDMLVDGAPLDNESILEEDAEELSSSVHLGLVLDTSYSMLQHAPPAFAPMLEAARNTLIEGRDLYAARPGRFTWSVVWFDELVYTPGEGWDEEDVLSIPEPAQGTATKLFGAVAHQAQAMLSAHDEIANGPNDHHVLVVFSDGADNYSWFDNSDVAQSGQTGNGSPFQAQGIGPATRQDAEAAIAGHPRLTSHVIGLGSAVNDADLSALAEAASGRYFKNLASSEVQALFEQVVLEFATIQDRGATIPLPPGDYTFTLRVRSAAGSGADELTFTFHAGDESAGVLDIGD